MKHNHGHTGLLIFATLVTVFVYALYAFVYVTIDRSVDRALAERETVYAEQLHASQGQNIMAVYEATRADRARLGALFVSEDATISFIETLESLGKEAGSDITLSSIDAEPADAGSFGSIRARIEARGSWSSVMKTLMLAEILPYRSSISRVQLDTSGSSGAKREWRVSFTLGATVVPSGT